MPFAQHPQVMPPLSPSSPGESTSAAVLETCDDRTSTGQWTQPTPGVGPCHQPYGGDDDEEAYDRTVPTSGCYDMAERTTTASPNFLQPAPPPTEDEGYSDRSLSRSSSPMDSDPGVRGVDDGAARRWVLVEVPLKQPVYGGLGCVWGDGMVLLSVWGQFLQLEDDESSLSAPSFRSPHAGVRRSSLAQLQEGIIDSLEPISNAVGQRLRRVWWRVGKGVKWRSKGVGTVADLYSLLGDCQAGTGVAHGRYVTIYGGSSGDCVRLRFEFVGEPGSGSRRCCAVQ
eukprot:TRINITY_DN28875_c0_g1_i1.p1 TRINITY_DN28875_c0_g1~~TRINITY_DN28875_c0_g1_i1.p1  ORF type:complete len:284 (+),score=89.95 TRINITY_DN28875_c0_g1_i1:55-906(+)